MIKASSDIAIVPRNEGVQQFLRFCMVGGVGFLVDAGVLSAELATGAIGPIAARFFSFACAVMVTFELNRRWAFSDAPARAYVPTLISYLGVQGGGFLCNLATYATLYFVLPPPLNHPLLCLGGASALALIVNFAGARLIVFRQRKSRP